MLLERLKNDHKPELKLNQLQREMKAQVDSKIEDGIYQFEHIECPICDSAANELIGSKDRYGLSFTTNICNSCGLVYTNPRMTQSSYNDFYNVEYRKLYNGKEKATASFYYSQTFKGEKIFNYLKANKLIDDEPLFVLEVGCGAGGILSAFKKRGHKVKGIDLGQEYVKYGRATHNLDLEVGFLADLKIDQKPDIIIYSHVLEHILDVNKELQTIKKSIAEDGVVYIEVPGIKEVHKNFESNILRYFQNAHTFHFSLETLKNLLAKNGFDLICGNQFVRSAFRLSNRTISTTNDFENVKKYLVQIEKKRWMYSFTAQGIKKRGMGLVLKTLEATKLRLVARKIKNSLVNKT